MSVPFFVSLRLGICKIKPSQCISILLLKTEISNNLTCLYFCLFLLWILNTVFFSCQTLFDWYSYRFGSNNIFHCLLSFLPLKNTVYNCIFQKDSASRQYFNTVILTKFNIWTTILVICNWPKRTAFVNRSKVG